MDIKKIAQKIAPDYWKRDQWNIEYFDSVGFAEALISAYKAELLKEVGEPVLYAEFAEDGGWLGDASEYADHLEEPHALFTSDQLAAAIIKATKPLEEEVERLMADNIAFARNLKGKSTTTGATYEHLCAQLAKAEQLWQIAQGRCDGLEEKLVKAEQRVAEACKSMCLSLVVADFIDSGEWRKFVKEV